MARGVPATPDELGAALAYGGACVPVALARVTGFPLGEMIDALRRTPSTVHRGAMFPGPAGGVSRCDTAHFVHGLGAQELVGVRGMTLAQFCQRHPRGRYLVHVRRHALAIIDGVIVDPYGGYHCRRRVELAFKFSEV